jgi:hypothetical protein
MRRLVPALLFTTAAAIPTAHAQRVTLDSLRDRQRALVVFSNGNNALAEQQLKIAADHAADFRERDLVLVGLEGTDPSVPTAMLTPAAEEQARKRFHTDPQQFTVILIGKDGGEKLRSHQPVPWTKLQSTIDAMPMRQQEMRDRARPR